MDAIKTFICGFGTGILFSTFLCICYLFSKRLSGAKGNTRTADNLNREAANENRRITGLEQREAGILDEAERDNREAANENRRITGLEQREAGILDEAERDNRKAREIVKKAKDILDRYNDSSSSSDIDTNL